jgi:hypothetical protein
LRNIPKVLPQLLSRLQYLSLCRAALRSALSFFPFVSGVAPNISGLRLDCCPVGPAARRQLLRRHPSALHTAIAASMLVLRASLQLMILPLPSLLVGVASATGASAPSYSSGQQHPHVRLTGVIAAKPEPWAVASTNPKRPLQSYVLPCVTIDCESF